MDKKDNNFWPKYFKEMGKRLDKLTEVLAEANKQLAKKVGHDGFKPSDEIKQRKEEEANEKLLQDIKNLPADGKFELECEGEVTYFNHELYQKILDKKLDKYDHSSTIHATDMVRPHCRINELFIEEWGDGNASLIVRMDDGQVEGFKLQNKEDYD